MNKTAWCGSPLPCSPGTARQWPTGFPPEGRRQCSALGRTESGPRPGGFPEAVLENYRRFCGALEVPLERTVLSKQVHEATVRLCTAADAGKGLFASRDYTADALITRETDLPLVVFSADCGIMLLYDPVHHAAGAVHAGWAGLRRRDPGKDRSGHG